jgi:hypothetical protein
MLPSARSRERSSNFPRVEIKKKQGRRREGDVGSGDNPQILSDCCCNLQDGKWVAPQDFIQSPNGRKDLALFIASTRPPCVLTNIKEW